MQNCKCGVAGAQHMCWYVGACASDGEHTYGIKLVDALYLHSNEQLADYCKIHAVRSPLALPPFDF